MLDGDIPRRDTRRPDHMPGMAQKCDALFMVFFIHGKSLSGPFLHIQGETINIFLRPEDGGQGFRDFGGLKTYFPHGGALYHVSLPQGPGTIER